jgi:hypothetical protein
MSTAIIKAAPIASGQGLTQAELERARLHLEQTKNGMLGAIRNISDAQWAFKPDTERWSVAEIVEHVITVLEIVQGPVREKLEASPAAAPLADYKKVDDIVIHQFPNRLAKIPSPRQPEGGLGLADAGERLVANYARLIEYLETAPDLREHSTEAMPLKIITNGEYVSMDGYQWILAASAHTERHTKQVLETIAAPGFPD